MSINNSFNKQEILCSQQILDSKNTIDFVLSFRKVFLPERLFYFRTTNIRDCFKAKLSLSNFCAKQIINHADRLACIDCIHAVTLESRTDAQCYYISK